MFFPAINLWKYFTKIYGRSFTNAFFALATTISLAASQTPKTEPENFPQSPATPSVSSPNSQGAIPTEEINATKPSQILFVGKDSFNPDTGQYGDLYQAQDWQGARQAAKDFQVGVNLLPNQC